MTKSPRIGSIILLVALIGGVAWEFLRSREPVYNGRTLHSWLAQYSSNSPPIPNNSPPQQEITLQEDSKRAIQQVGSNAVPTLIRMAGTHDSALKSNLLVLARKWLRVHPLTEEEYHSFAVLGFYALGSLGKDGVPSLTELLKSRDASVRGTAADCLGNIGPAAEAAIPILVQFLSDTNESVRWDATINLGRIHMQPDVAVPRLIKNLNTSNTTLLATTIFALGQFGENAKPAVPALLPDLHDADGYVRLRTTNALKRIDPESSAKHGVK
jgi:HEAT repeat protein